MVRLLVTNYSTEIRDAAIKYRRLGNTYQEINLLLELNIPKSTYSTWFKGVVIASDKRDLLANKILDKLIIARRKAVQTNKAIRKRYLEKFDQDNVAVSKKINDIDSAKIGLALLCLGEASKSKSGSGFYMGNSDYRIIVLFVKLLKYCFLAKSDKFRFTVQCRADQNVEKLEEYWRHVVGIQNGQFYKAKIDPRTIGKPTLDKDYMGVLRVDYTDKRIQLELESLAKMIYNQVVGW